MTRPLCIFHGGCPDGHAAAWIVRRALAGEVDFHPGVYGEAPPDVAGRDVIMVDFSYRRPVLDVMAAQAHSILVLDHHKSAQEDLADVPDPGKLTWDFRKDGCGFVYVGYIADDSPSHDRLLKPNLRAIFDMNRSGASMTWDYFYAQPRPKLIDYIEDRDLWRKALPYGDEFTIALKSYSQTFEKWDELFCRDGFISDVAVNQLINEGVSLQRYYRLRVEELKRAAYWATISRTAGRIWAPGDDHLILVANAPYFAASGLAGELAAVDGAAFGACFFEAGPGRWQYSLRSRGDFDVSAVATAYGGGGHKGAAGFTVPELVHRKADVGPGGSSSDV